MVCNNSFIHHTYTHASTHSANDLIPSSALFSADGTAPNWTGVAAESCTLVSAGELFYTSQQSPPECSAGSWCSLSGVNQAQSSVLTILQAADGRTELMVVHDATSDTNSDGGEMLMYMDASSLGGMGVQVELFDDRTARNFSNGVDWFGTCANKNGDCHSWDTSLGKGYFHWVWVSEASLTMTLSDTHTQGATH